MDGIPELVNKVSSGVISLTLERERERVGSGTGFLAGDYLITASHVIRGNHFDAMSMKFKDFATDESIRLDVSAVLSAIICESPESEHDVAILSINEPEFSGRHRFVIGSANEVVAGQQVLILGYPYDSPHLAAHIAFVSSVHFSGNSKVLQLDGSVNPSNSGGPVLDLLSGEVLGYVVRVQTGLERDFDLLIEALRGNVEALEPRTGGVLISGIDPVRGLQVTMNAMIKLAFNMKRSANVGIGYANAADHIAALLN